MMLQNMPPTYHVTLDPTRAGYFGHMFIRREVSYLNTRYDMFLQCHKAKDGSMTIWHNPNVPNKDKSEAFDKLVLLQRRMNEFKALKDQSLEPNAYLPEMFALQDQIDECLGLLKRDENAPKQHQSPGAIRQPLNVILNHLCITEAIWNLLPPRVQLKQRIRAEIEIRDTLKAKEQPLKDVMKLRLP